MGWGLIIVIVPGRDSLIRVGVGVEVERMLYGERSPWRILPLKNKEA